MRMRNKKATEDREKSRENSWMKRSELERGMFRKILCCLYVER
jgi:hypothetical protein